MRKTKLSLPTASDLTKGAIQLLTYYGFKVWRNNNAGVYDVRLKQFRANSVGLKGVSDVIGYQLKTGRAIYVEIKAGADKLSDEQRHFLINAIENGCIAFEVRCIEDIKKGMEKFSIKIN